MNMLGSTFIGATMVGGDQDPSGVVDSGGGVVHGQSRVGGSLSFAGTLTAVVATRTTVIGSKLAIPTALAGRVNGATAVVVNLQRNALLSRSTSAGSTVLIAAMFVERERVLTLFGSAGISADRSLVVHGMATAGTGIRQVGHPVDLPEKVSRLATFYV